jgi:Fe-S oxidoreductase
VPDILRFSMYEKEYQQEGRGARAYASLIVSERAAHCAHCSGLCERACGYDLPIRTLLIDAHRRPAEGYPRNHAFDARAG